MKNILSKHLLFTRRSSPNTSQSGFSLIELMVVTVMIGVLSTIAAAGWEAFTTRQRIRTVNDQVFQALRSAQSDAKLKKTTMVVEFDKTADPPKYRTYVEGTSDAQKDQLWQSVGKDGSIKLGQVKFRAVSTSTGASVDVSEIKFDYLGALPSDTKTPIYIVTTIKDDQGTYKGKRCVIIETLLGGMRSSKGTIEAGKPETNGNCVNVF